MASAMRAPRSTNPSTATSPSSVRASPRRLVADALIATGKRIVVLDSRDIAQGSTAASTALLQYEIDTHLVELTGLLGADAAMRAYLACAASFSLLEQRFPELLPLAGYERRESLYLASDEKAVPALRAELAARRGIGLACEWLDGEAVREPVWLPTPRSDSLGAGRASRSLSPHARPVRGLRAPRSCGCSRERR